MARMRYQQALAKALRDEMLRDPSVFVLGEDVRASLRGVTRGLAAELGEQRIIDTPISEQAFTGFAMGAALAGHRPVVEYQIPSLLFTAFEPIVNQAQKFRLMTGGQAKVPVTYIVPGSGARMGLAAQHSDHPYALFAQAGVKTVVPATASDAYGLFVAAIRDDDPVVFFAPAAALGSREEVADDAEPIPLGVGRVHRSGDDVTVVAVGHLVRDALAVAEALAASEDGATISVEVFDPRTIHPFDWEGLRASVAKTGRLVVTDDTNRTCGLAAEVVATAAEEFADLLVAPPKRITRADAPIPFAVELEVALLPSREQLTDAIRAVAAVGPGPRPAAAGAGAGAGTGAAQEVAR
ncbi:transketolase C-terminal domain-containing protein [Conexibacter sp. CPCC 206217]|nr:transketolase C-terminal domain-containing protein [Conexibacter sp. CPCC 206217]MDO8209946.1 transketolase C-terminal domain-containing protein [Conexibacter sp. CPCC 206217]